MQAITATYYGPTNHKGSRIKLKARDHKARWHSFDYEAPHGAGVTLDDVKAYALSCFPRADVDTVRGPFATDNPNAQIFTLGGIDR